MKKGVLLTITFVFLVFINFVDASNVGLVDNSTWGNELTGVRFPSLASGDLDGDGDNDLALIGCLTDGGFDCENGAIAKIYINNGTSLVENSTWQDNLTGVGFGSIAFVDIDNDGDLDLSILGCDSSVDLSCASGNHIAKIYINNGTSLIESSQWQNNLIGTFNGVFDWGDINNDGRLDLIIVGQRVANPYYTAKIYINNGTSLIESSQWQNDLTGIYQGEAVFGDIDNDGDLDLSLTGDTGSLKISKIYINNGTSLIESSTWQQNLLGVDRSSINLGDYDNDGDLDLNLIGQIAGDFQFIYVNDGTSFIENQSKDVPGDLIGIFRGSIAFGDYDNDGDLDLAATGKEEGYARIYENNASNNYYYQNDALAHSDISNNILQSAVLWIDIDNDGDLDIVISGADSTALISNIYINNNTVSNTQPSAPSTFTSNFTDGVLNLSWGNGTDTETGIMGLYYNLMIGNSTANHTIVSGVYGSSSNPTSGYFGNMMQRKAISLNVDLADGTYNWYVQTIDTGLAKSEWSAVQSFSVTDDSTAPNLTNVDSSSVTSTTATVTWTSDETGNSTVYYGTSVALGSSSGSADLVSSHSVSLSGLTASTLYYYNVSSCDYFGNCNVSVQYNFTTSAAVVNNPGSSPSGNTNPSSGLVPKTYSVGESELREGYTKELSKGNKVSFSSGGENHSLEFHNIVGVLVNMTLSSDPINFLIRVGEEKKFDLNDNSVLDLLVRLNSIVSGKVNLTIQEIQESYDSEVSGDDDYETGTLADEEVSEIGDSEEILENGNSWLYGSITVIIILVIILVIYFRNKK